MEATPDVYSIALLTAMMLGAAALAVTLANAVSAGRAGR